LNDLEKSEQLKNVKSVSVKKVLDESDVKTQPQIETRPVSFLLVVFLGDSLVA
jgi:hypothetical protein